MPHLAPVLHRQPDHRRRLVFTPKKLSDIVKILDDCFLHKSMREENGIYRCFRLSWGISVNRVDFLYYQLSAGYLYAGIYTKPVSGAKRYLAPAQT